MRTELGGHVAPQRLMRAECDLEPAEVVAGQRVPVATEHEDHARSLPDHVARRSRRGQEHRPHGGDDRALEVLEPHVDERRALDVAVRDQVERDVDAAGVCNDRVGVLVHRLLVQGIELRRLGHPSGRTDVLGDLLEALHRAAGEVDPCALARKCTRDRAADRPAPSVDDRVLAL